MKLLVINPNTTARMTERMLESARRVAPHGWDVIGETARQGASSIDGYYEDLLGAAAVCETVLCYEGKVDAFVIGCTDDPALLAARELTKVPVVGSGEASFLCAMPLGHRFSVLTTIPRSAAVIEHLLELHGVRGRCASVRVSGLTVLECEDASRTAAALEAAGRRALDEDGAEVLCLACAGMSGLAERLTAALKVPVIDPIAAATSMAVSLVAMGLRTSKACSLQTPESMRPNDAG